MTHPFDRGGVLEGMRDIHVVYTTYARVCMSLTQVLVCVTNACAVRNDERESTH